jgi:hypothetical protein
MISIPVQVNITEFTVNDKNSLFAQGSMEERGEAELSLPFLVDNFEIGQ